MMDKVKAYDEALERARKMLDKILNNELIGFPDQIREIFPQLKESDDEKIRKSLIEFLTDIKEISESGRTVWAVREDDAEMCESFIAYLEKQKECIVDNTSEDEQKSTDDKAFEEWIDSWFKEYKEKAYPQITMDEKKFKNFCRGIRNMYQQKSDWNEEDEMMRENIISNLRYFRNCATDEEAVSGYNDEIAWLKDISLNHKKFIEAVDKLWSNEWSKEDEKDIADIIEILDDCYASGRHDLSKTNHENLVNKLKSLHPIKQDWTEEDEEIWFALITFFKIYLQKYPPACKDEKIQANRILKWLNTTIKSFRLHHRYKPSEEQMKALKNSAYGTYQNGDGPALRELYEQLLKLGVKEDPEYYRGNVGKNE